MSPRPRGGALRPLRNAYSAVLALALACSASQVPVSDGGPAADAAIDWCYHDRTYQGVGRPHPDSLYLALVGPTGTLTDCGGRRLGDEVSRTVEGVAALESDGTLAVEGCDQILGCGRYRVRSTLEAPRLLLRPGIPSGRNVVLTFRAIFTHSGCATTLSVRDVADPTRWWIFAARGTQRITADLPFDLTLDNLGCHPGANCAGGIADDQALRFVPKDGSPSLVLATGERGSLVPSRGHPSMAVWNVRSYQTRGCDDYGNYSYWLAVDGTEVPF